MNGYPAVLTAALIVAATVLAGGSRPERRLRRIRWAGDGPRPHPVARALRGLPALRRLHGGGYPEKSEPPVVDVAELAVRLAALVRAGLPPHRGWEALAQAPGTTRDTCAVVAAHLAAGGTAGDGLRTVPGPDGLAWLAVAHDSADRAGAPLADVLDGFAVGMREDERAAADRDAALAGPRATGTVLSALPAAGIGLGFLLGANPVAALLGTGPGRGALVAGVGLWLAGRRWTAVLVGRAERAGERV